MSFGASGIRFSATAHEVGFSSIKCLELSMQYISVILRYFRICHLAPRCPLRFPVGL
jgi:hypothetical protein